jgi:predicted ATP-grasp superfamily ATP-dependent carboligase
MRDGSYKLIEVNPKLWGTLGLSIKAGMNFALKACELAAHGTTNPQSDYKIGLKYKILFPLEFYTIYQDKGHRFNRIKKLLEVFETDTVTELDIKDFMPNLMSIIATFRALVFQKNVILPRGREFPQTSHSTASQSDSE